MLPSASREGADPNITIWALKRAISLIKELAGGKISMEIADIYPSPVINSVIKVNYNNINRLIGKRLNRLQLKKFLHSLTLLSPGKCR